MPKYEYACKSCGEHIEVKQSFKDDPLTECPTCGGVLRKVFSSPGIVLRGPGFYRTDHRSPYRPDGTRPAERDKDREPATKGDDSKAGSSSSESSGSKDSKDSKDSKAAASAAAAEKKASGESKSSGSSDAGGSKDPAARTA
ncbi:MAG TPA: FmdB family zinc ribbon protein [Acidimicrobiales bacterium]